MSLNVNWWRARLLERPLAYGASLPKSVRLID